jgi:polar amino acid transport system substrate-binding protein
MYRRTAAVVAAFAVILTACGGTGDGDTPDNIDEALDDAQEETDDTEPADEPAEEPLPQVTACSPDELDTHEDGTLTVATGEPAFPPWVEDDDPESGQGFEAAVVYALANELGYDDADVTWVRTGFDEAIAPGPKEYDVNIQQFSIIEERREVVDFSVPYYLPDKAVVALPDSPVADATSFDDLREANWGATIGTTDLDYLEEIIGAGNVSVFDDQAGTFQALQGGQIDATVVALPTALFATAVQVPEASITAVLPPDENDEGLGLLMEQGSPLLDCVNEALTTLRSGGVLDDLATEWLGVGGDIPAITE